MSVDFLALPAFTPAGDVHVVVESPKGSRAKWRYEPCLSVFSYSRPLPLGLTYPFDWGFVPSTCAADGDPIDGLVLHDAVGYQGSIIPSKPLGILEIEQTEGGKTERNDRLIFRPSKARSDLSAHAVLSQSVKADLEQFFVDAVKGTGKALRILGWKDADAAIAAVRTAYALYKRRAG